MIAYHPSSEHNPRNLKIRYDNLVRSGFRKKQRLAEDATKALKAAGTPTASPEPGTERPRLYGFADNKITMPDVSMLERANRMLLQQTESASLPSLVSQCQPEDGTADTSQLQSATRALVDYDSDE